MIAYQDVDLARRWLHDQCHRAHIRSVLERGLAFVDAIERAGLCVESIDAADLYGFLAEVADTPAFHRRFVQPEL